MAKFFGYVLIFVLGFAACAFILRTTGQPGGYNGGATARGRETIGQALAEPPRAMATLAAASSAVADAAAKVEPAVVNIDVASRATAPDLPSRLRGLLGQGRGSDLAPEIEGSGSGIIVSGDGYVVTNNHVIEPVLDEKGKQTGKMTITLDNGRSFRDVRVIGRDQRSDLAVVKIANAKGLPAAQLGDSDKLRVGDWAIAVGNPLGFNSTVTLGIVSALNRRNLGAENQTLDRVIQTDAAINPGNSGGALADISGRVIGINTAIISRTGTSIGIGFAIPVNQARRIIKDLVAHGSVVRPYLGVRYTALDDAVRRRLPQSVVLPGDDLGAIVLPDQGQSGVTPKSPADKAGLRDFDVIREVAGRPVTGADVVKDEVLKRGVGDKLPLTVFRAGRTLRLTIVLEKMPADFALPARPREREPLLPFGLP